MISLFHYDVLGYKKDLENILSQSNYKLNLVNVKEKNEKQYQIKFDLYLNSITFLQDKISHPLLNELYNSMLDYAFINKEYIKNFELLMRNLDSNREHIGENIYFYWYEKFYPYYQNEILKNQIRDMEVTITGLRHEILKHETQIRNMQAGNQYLMRELENYDCNRAPFSPINFKQRHWVDTVQSNYKR